MTTTRPYGSDHHEQEALLASYGLSVAERRTVTDVEDAVAAAEQIGWPVALKAPVRDRRKRTALGGVGVDIADEGDLGRRGRGWQRAWVRA